MKAEMKEVPGWMSLKEAADLLGITKQGAHAMADAGKFREVRVLRGTRLHCVRNSDVERLVAERAEAREVREHAVA